MDSRAGGAQSAVGLGVPPVERSGGRCPACGIGFEANDATRVHVRLTAAHQCPWYFLQYETYKCGKYGVNIRLADRSDVDAMADAHRDSIQSVGAPYYPVDVVAGWLVRHRWRTLS